MKELRFGCAHAEEAERLSEENARLRAQVQAAEGLREALRDVLSYPCDAPITILDRARALMKKTP